MGADSRQFSLDFSITLPHLLDQHRDLVKDKYLLPYRDPRRSYSRSTSIEDYRSEAASITDFFKEGKTHDSAKQVLLSPWALKGITPSELEYLKSRYNIKHPNAILGKLQSGFANYKANKAALEQGQPINEPKVNNTDESLVKRLNLIDLIIYWVNIIRSSVTNNTDNPIYGPPIIRLNHGIMYQDIPCICQNYSISHEENAGYDLDTLLPRRLKITMKLEEFRAGDYGDFTRGKNADPIKRDNLAGWEAVISPPYSMDPGYIMPGF
tara:strand:+ start:31 stop:831 length:801 start_codon:yes stop_codon:yes gene_type:complete